MSETPRADKIASRLRTYGGGAFFVIELVAALLAFKVMFHSPLQPEPGACTLMNDGKTFCTGTENWRAFWEVFSGTSACLLTILGLIIAVYYFYEWKPVWEDEKETAQAARDAVEAERLRKQNEAIMAGRAVQLANEKARAEQAVIDAAKAERARVQAERDEAERIHKVKVEAYQQRLRERAQWLAKWERDFEIGKQRLVVQRYWSKPGDMAPVYQDIRDFYKPLCAQHPSLGLLIESENQLVREVIGAGEWLPPIPPMPQEPPWSDRQIDRALSAIEIALNS